MSCIVYWQHCVRTREDLTERRQTRTIEFDQPSAGKHAQCAARWLKHENTHTTRFLKDFLLLNFSTHANFWLSSKNNYRRFFGNDKESRGIDPYTGIVPSHPYLQFRGQEKPNLALSVPLRLAHFLILLFSGVDNKLRCASWWDAHFRAPQLFFFWPRPWGIQFPSLFARKDARCGKGVKCEYCMDIMAHFSGRSACDWALCSLGT